MQMTSFEIPLISSKKHSLISPEIIREKSQLITYTEFASQIWIAVFPGTGPLSTLYSLHLSFPWKALQLLPCSSIKSNISFYTDSIQTARDPCWQPKKNASQVQYEFCLLLKIQTSKSYWEYIDFGKLYNWHQREITQKQIFWLKWHCQQISKWQF